MGNAISFRLNPKNESDKRIIDWLEEKSSQPGFFNLTEVIKKAILTAIEDEQKEYDWRVRLVEGHENSK